MSDVYRSLPQSPQQLVETVAELSDTIGQLGQRWIETTTHQTGKTLDALAHNSFIQWISRLPGANQLLAFLGQVDVAQMQREVMVLQQAHPLESPRQIADRVIQQGAIQAGTVGFVTNLVPPLALSLLAVDLAAMTRLQAEMVYRIAAAYGFPLADPARRGEVLGIFALSMVGGGVLKAGASLAEILPLIGTVSGAAVNATLMFALGQTACEFYETKQPVAGTVVTHELP
ncbi:EcsC family protein [Acaryochloris sp. CCMEE 5410]|uniref:EcsC family protein n=1 Tax=Acaryochloris sp. CCMEE 5410 TaxID=310037 RepID=UPI0002484ED7|nr:EcsC family protein [Acaryochloris sp. CCMEE 5410]KAI9132302.1 EcsC family protein [Acaryochloris sp. CCMEE 5410]